MNVVPRIALFADTYHELNGAANFLRRLTDFARSRDYPFLCIRAGEKTELTKDGSVQFLSLKRSFASVPLDGFLRYDPFLWRYQGLVKRTVEDFEPNSLHLTGLNDISQLGFVLSHKKKLPAVATWHTNTHEYAASRLTTRLRWLPEKTLNKIGSSVEKFTMNGLMKLYFMAQMQLAPNPELVEEIGRMTNRPSYLLRRGVDTDNLNPAKRTRKDDAFVLGFVGRLRPEKNVRFLAKIEEKLLANNITNYRFLIVGDGSERGWLERNLSSAQFTGEIHGNELTEAFANMDLFVFPSLTDAFANVVLEAMSSGVPAISFAVGGPKFLIENGVSGFVADTEDELCQTAVDILKDTSVIEPMRNEARHFAELHSWTRIFELNYEYYRVLQTFKKNVRSKDVPPEVFDPTEFMLSQRAINTVE